MPEAAGIPDFNSRVVEHARKDFPLLDADMIVAEALDRIRREGIGERVIYFFAVDADKRLVGVLPTRRLLTAPLDTPLHEIMVRRVIAIPASASVLDACEFFVLYKFFAFPVVDEHRRVVGVIDASLFADEILQAGESEDRQRPAAPVRDDLRDPGISSRTNPRCIAVAVFSVPFPVAAGHGGRGHNLRGSRRRV
jgi:magnesium transporter